MIPLPEDLEILLREHGARATSNREIAYGTQHRIQRGSETVPLNVFRTGKVSVGGKESGLRDLIEDWRIARSSETRGRDGEPRVGPPAPDATPRIGIDEAGKGDYFGPLVVAGVRVSGEETAKNLSRLGVRDSKTLSASQVRGISRRLPDAVGRNNARVLALYPEEYEARRTRAGDVNRLLGELDIAIMGELEDQVEVIVVDRYAASAREHLEPFVPEGVRLEVRSRAEDDAAVAAASVLARARYLEAMDELSGLVGFGLPRGATHVLEAGRRVFRELGMAGLKEVAKVSFKTTQRITGDKL